MWQLSNKLLCFLQLQDSILSGKRSESGLTHHICGSPTQALFSTKMQRGCFLLVYCLVFNDNHNTIKRKEKKNHSVQTRSRPWPFLPASIVPFGWNETKLPPTTQSSSLAWLSLRGT